MTRMNSLCLGTLLIATSGCGGGSDTAADMATSTPTSPPTSASVTTTIRATTLPPPTTTTQAPAIKIQLSRETLLALQKCSSESTSASFWAYDPSFIDDLTGLADLCENANDQLEVDKQLNSQVPQSLLAFIVELSGWNLILRQEILKITIGREGNVTLLFDKGFEFTTKVDAFLSSIRSE